MKSDEQNVNKLYRYYQEHRDSVPSSVLNNILKSAQVAQREKNIDTIVTAAAIATAKQARRADQNSQSTSPKSSIFERCSSWYRDSIEFMSARPAALAFSVMLILAMPIALTLKPSTSLDNNIYQDVSYITGCNDCDQWLLSSTVAVRSVGIGSSDQNVQGVAQLGRLAAALEIAAHTSTSDKVAESLITAVSRVATQNDYVDVAQHFNQLTPSLSAMSGAANFLNTHFSRESTTSQFHLGQWLERLRVSNLLALSKNQFNELPKALNGIDQLLIELDNANSGVALKPELQALLEELAGLQKAETFSRQTAETISYKVEQAISLISI